jgi:hypothetical protein
MSAPRVALVVAMSDNGVIGATANCRGICRMI